MKWALMILFLSLTFNGYNQNMKKLVEANGLSVGENAPLFSALNADSLSISLKKELQKGPVVLIFYRGFWCPVCNKHLGTLQDSLSLIQDAGATVLAVSPEKPDYLDKMAHKTGAAFNLLYDKDYRIANAYDVNFKPKAVTLMIYNVALGAQIKKSHSDASQQLPIPATFIINRKGKIIWRQFDRNYHKRSSVKEIVTALQQEKIAENHNP